jgi:hypothetical protein
MEMITVGCSEGRPATAWTTWIVNLTPPLRVGGRPYQAIECVHAPKQGRSGGGLYTLDGHVAGVCDFAEPAGDRGLYAAPQSIYRMLDRNRLMALYDPSAAARDTLVAQNSSGRASATARKPAPAHTLRAQSPDPNETRRVTMPTPELLGIKTPAVASTSNGGPPSATTERSTWHPSQGGTSLANASTRSGQRPQRTIEPAAADFELPIATDMETLPSPADDPLMIPPRPDDDRAPAVAPAPAPVRPANSNGWRAVRSEAGATRAEVELPTRR